MRLALAFALTLAAGPIAAQDNAALARQYAELPQVQAMFDTMLSPEAFVAQFRASVPGRTELTDDQIARIGAVMGQMMSSIRPDLTEITITAMSENFSSAEINALIDFYSSPEGASVMAKMQPFTAQTMAQLAPVIQRHQQEILPELIAIIQE